MCLESVINCAMTLNGTVNKSASRNQSSSQEGVVKAGLQNLRGSQEQQPNAWGVELQTNF